MAIYYYANQVYQLSYALPFYNKIGGKFIVNSISKYWRFKKHLQSLAAYNENTFLKTPSIIIRKNGQMQDLEGIILSFSNDWIYRNPKKCKIIFHEHGASDKHIGSNSKAKTVEKLKNFDYIFLMSPKNLIKLNALNANLDENNFVKIYNMRFANYDSMVPERAKILTNLKIKDPTKKIVLYAPTWRFGNGTLRKYFHRFAKEITQEYNLIVRPHFHEAKLIPQYRIWAKLHNIKNLYFSNPSNLAKHDTMTDFVASDILLSDTSAVLYEYLVSQKPIIIINPNYDKRVEMPAEMDIMKNSVIFNETDNINQVIAQTLKEQKYSKNYNKMFADCFYVPSQTDVKNAISFLKEI
ncbi:MAG: CDP-glycerol glycerophosphotransferase family protein [Candidatus Cloacimonetes bacterium]|nr:CDP-glycerol glycerophosphotransferase family protein [Candidatus Cloacimonadota bacterium]